jgi:hypothetical protein
VLDVHDPAGQSDAGVSGVSQRNDPNTQLAAIGSVCAVSPHC